MRPPLILDTTLRDGSYAINFQFTASDTAILCGELDRAGFPLIEIGHGIGFGASEKDMGRAAETDEAYLEAAAGSIKTAKWGMFCIPGIARLDHVDLAAQYGMSFIRIGTEVERAGEAAEFIERAKKHDMFVCANFMKSYSLEPEEFAQKALLSQQLGADAVYIVDSAGGMMAKDLERYIRAIQDVSDVAIGFHGHNNLELAVSNTMRAIELGVAIVDTSLQGMGRSAGNTPAEILLMVMGREGMHVGIDPLHVQDIGEKYIKPLIQRRGYDAIDIVSGSAQFHSSYMGIVREFSSKYRVDPRRLIMALCAVDRVNAPRELVDSLARGLVDSAEEVFTARFHLDRYFGAEQNPGKAD